MNKIKLCFKILFSDNYVVFTWKDAPNYSEYMTAPKYSWESKEYDSYFFWFIKDTINSIIRKHNMIK